MCTTYIQIALKKVHLDGFKVFFELKIDKNKQIVNEHVLMVYIIKMFYLYIILTNYIIGIFHSNIELFRY